MHILNEPQHHITHEEAQRQIYLAKYDAVKTLVYHLDKTIEELDSKYHALHPKSESKIIAHYAARTQILEFRMKLLDTLDGFNAQRSEELNK